MLRQMRQVLLQELTQHSLPQTQLSHKPMWHLVMQTLHTVHKTLQAYMPTQPILLLIVVVCMLTVHLRQQTQQASMQTVLLQKLMLLTNHRTPLVHMLTQHIVPQTPQVCTLMVHLQQPIVQYPIQHYCLVLKQPRILTSQLLQPIQQLHLYKPT